MDVNFRMLDFDQSSEPTWDDMIAARKDIDLAGKIYAYVRSKCPGGLIIRVSVTTQGGIAMLQHPLLPPHIHYVIHLKDLANEYGWRQVRRAVGLLLEIFNLPRDCYNANFFREIFRERSKQHRDSKLGIVKREVNLATGQSKVILPDYMGQK